MNKINYCHPVKFNSNSKLEFLEKDVLTDVLPMRPNDFLRWLIPKRQLLGNNINSVDLVLLKNTKGDSTPFEARTPVSKIGLVRPQSCETYTKFRLRVDSFEAGRFFQFALAMDGGSLLMEPFGCLCENQDQLISELAEYFESFAHATVLTKVNGSIIDVTMMHSRLFRLFGGLGVVIGESLAINENSPSLRVDLISTGNTQAGYKVYELGLKGTIVEGNVFTLNGGEYVARAGDTLANVSSALTIDGELSILDTDFPIVRFTAGSRTNRNVNPAKVFANKSTTSGGFDRYTIRVDSFQVGNIITISTVGKSVTYIVKSGDSANTIEAALSPNSGYFDVPSGNIIRVSGLVGSQVIQNDNNVNFYLTEKEVVGSYSYSLYGVSIGSDVVKGNVFKLGDKEVVATSLDTNISIAEKLSGFSSNYFTMRSTETLIGSSEVGGRYTNEDLLSISIMQQPYVEESSFAVAEATLPDYGVIEYGSYVLALWESVKGYVISVGNSVNYGDNIYTSLIEVADVKECFGFHYGEAGLTQRLRLPLMLRAETAKITETKGTRIDGSGYTGNVQINYTAPFSMHSSQMNTAKGTLHLLKHAHVMIDGSLVTIEDSETNILSEQGRFAELFGTVMLLEDTVNNYNKTLYPNLFSSGSVIVSCGYLRGLQLLISDTNFTRTLRMGQNSVPAGGYFLKVRGDSLTQNSRVRLTVRSETSVLLDTMLNKGDVSRSATFRAEIGSVIRIETEELGFVRFLINYVQVEMVETEEAQEMATTQISRFKPTLVANMQRFRYQVIDIMGVVRGDSFGNTFMIGAGITPSEHTIKAQVKKWASDDTVLLDIDVDIDQQAVHLSKSASDMDITPGVYNYDIEFTNIAEGYVFTLIGGKFEVIQDVTI
jgi:hypothetical protein